ncbi:hypothetical protein [Rhizobium sp. RU36D]|uniref:hypothetical protein n=1 Tax=Rhizobium sp. RU36D TaxID=1907415 RepID=UPI0009D7AB8D|nr:hypothetical protein [Rhizobium sp. RU36D]SMD02566.1 hypothetical protein SAMN05880593_11619 [Rhizobium sp. RU36D]
MEDQKISVTLTGPAKIDGKREPEGKTVSVTAAVALQLAASGVINPVRFAETELLAGEVEAAVRVAVADREANWATALDHFETMAEDRLNQALSDLDAANARIADLEAAAKADAETIAALEVALKAATAPPPTDPPPKAGQKSQTK